MKVLQANDGFLWADVTNIAESLWQSQDFELYAIYDDDSESLIESLSDLDKAIEQNNEIGIPVGLTN